MRALRLEQQRLGVDGGVAEIGVHHGRLFIAMHLLRNPGTQSIAIDVFANQHLNVDQSGLGDEERFRANVARWADHSSVVIDKTDSTVIDGGHIQNLAGGPVGMFSVDGGHTADIVCHDMRTAEQSLSHGGIVVADDVFNAQWPGVVEGTLRYLETGSLVPFGVGFNKVLFTHAAQSDVYRRVLSDLADRAIWHHKESQMAGHPVEIIWPSSSTIRTRKLAKRAVRRLQSSFVPFRTKVATIIPDHR